MHKTEEANEVDGVSHYKIFQISAIKGNQFVNSEAIYEHWNRIFQGSALHPNKLARLR